MKIKLLSSCCCIMLLNDLANKLFIIKHIFFSLYFANTNVDYSHSKKTSKKKLQLKINSLSHTHTGNLPR